MNLAKRSWWSLGVLVALGVASGAWYAAALAQEEGERGEREERRGEARREVREGREREEREVRIRREREGRDREEGEERERAERRPTEREVIQHRIEVLKIAMPALLEAERRDAAEIVERAIHAYRMEVEGRRDDEAHQIRERAPNRGQLAEILRAAAEQWREFKNEEKAAAVGRLAMELGGEGRRERRLHEIMPDRVARPDRPAPPQVRPNVQREIEELRGQLRQLHGQMREMHQQMERIQDILKSFVDEDDDEEVGDDEEDEDEDVGDDDEDEDDDDEDDDEDEADDE